MPVKVKCTSCEKVLTAPDQARGKAIKCPNCQSVVAVPRESKSADAKKPVSAKSKESGKPKRKVEQQIEAGPDSEELLANLNLSKVADEDASICPKCGADIWDEEAEDCPKCGINLATGDLGEKAKRKLMKGPDPARFYENIWGDAWSFTMKNHGVAWRTFAYLLSAYLILALSLYCLVQFYHLFPLRIFWSLPAFIGIALFPGWYWCYSIETTRLTLERKDKFKRLPFDFFQASAMGVSFFGWSLIYAIPSLIGIFVLWYLFLNQNVDGIIKPWMVALASSTGLLPFLWLYPPFMAQMASSAPIKGWIPWKLVPTWFRHAQASFVWLMISLPFALPMIISVCVIGGVWGSRIDEWRRNSMTNQRVVFAQKYMEDNASKAESKVKPTPEEKAYMDQIRKDAQGTVVEIDNKVLIVPAVLVLFSLIPLSYGYSVAARIQGQFTYFFSKSLDLDMMERQRKYVARLKRETEEDELEPKGMSLGESLAVVGVLHLVGIIGAVIYSSLTGTEMVISILIGLFIAGSLSVGTGRLMLLHAAYSVSTTWGILFYCVPLAPIFFIFMHWEAAKKGFFVYLAGSILFFTTLLVGLGLIVGGVVVLNPGDSPAPAAPAAPAGPGAAPAPAAPVAPAAPMAPA